MKYKLLLIDIDDTLLDFHADARKALARTWKELSLPPVESLYEKYEHHNRKLWNRLERGEIGTRDIQKERFRALVQDLRLKIEPSLLTDHYEANLSREATLYEGVYETLEVLRQKYILVAATNGIAHVQKGRMEIATVLDTYFVHQIVSEEMGVSKPDASFFQRGLKHFSHIPKSNLLMIGDSLTSDIMGAQNIGIDACWINRDNKKRPEGLPIVYEVTSFPEVTHFL